MAKVDMRTIAKHLDARTDNYFAYDEEAQAWVIAQTWHIWLHRTKTKKDKYEVRMFRAARRYDEEPTEADIIEFARISHEGLEKKMAEGIWYGDMGDDDAPLPPWRFNRWFIKDHKQL